MIPDLEKLWKLTGVSRTSFGENENIYFDPIGLILLKEPVNWEYWCTPTNSVTFATTGGDGVHFGFLCNDGQPTDKTPIVMTLPCADTPNIIVGENFKEFLALGCRTGYFDLEQIEYQPESHIPYLDSHTYSEEAMSNEIEMLNAIENEFSLKPWKNHKARLSELQLKFLNSLKYSDEYHEITT